MAWSSTSGDPVELVLYEALETEINAMAPTSYKTTPAFVSAVEDNVFEVKGFPAALISQPVLTPDYDAIKSDGALVIWTMELAVRLVVREGNEKLQRQQLKNFVWDLFTLCSRNDQWPDTGGACRARSTRVQPDVEYERLPGQKAGVLFADVPVSISFGTLSTDPSEPH